jgi:uncharacterized protein YdeI (YjbR/CyaY-like superfamily)
VPPRYFRSQLEFHRWLARHHARRAALLVGFYKRGCGRPSLTWPESVDAALCFGWIDGVRRRIDAERYSIRFTPRLPQSVWSAVNRARVRALSAAGRMQAAGLAAFARRGARRAGGYSYERRPRELPPRYAARLARNLKARRFFAAQPPSYRRAATWWVVSAKLETTRARRLAALIACCARTQRLPQFGLRRPGRR